MTEEKVSTTYFKKVTIYCSLQEKVWLERLMFYVWILPVVFTFNGFVHMKSMVDLKNKLLLILDYVAFIKNTLLKVLKDFIYYVLNKNSLYLLTISSLVLLREDSTLTTRVRLSWTSVNPLTPWFDLFLLI